MTKASLELADGVNSFEPVQALGHQMASMTIRTLTSAPVDAVKTQTAKPTTSTSSAVGKVKHTVEAKQHKVLSPSARVTKTTAKSPKSAKSTKSTKSAKPAKTVSSPGTIKYSALKSALQSSRRRLVRQLVAIQEEYEWYYEILGAAYAEEDEESIQSGLVTHDGHDDVDMTQ